MEEKIVKHGQIIGVKKEKLEEYLYLHQHIPADIHQMLLDAGFRKLEIYVQELPNGECYLFQYNEQLADGDSRVLENDRYRDWLEITGQCQQPLPEETFWKDMDLAFTL